MGRVIIQEPAAAAAAAAAGKHKQGQQQDVVAGLGLSRAGSGRGLALPFTPMSVAFKDISYFVPQPSVSSAGVGFGELLLGG
jgi:hypothetical protein